MEPAAAAASDDRRPLLAAATRLHLGHASRPPSPSRLRESLASFARLASSAGAGAAVVAVDAEERLEGYDLVAEVTRICDELASRDGDGDGGDGPTLRVLPVMPWGKFVPALNAIVCWCARAGAASLLMASAEVGLTRESADELRGRLDPDTTLVVGAALRGHEHAAAPSPGTTTEEASPAREVALTGRTCPWNTCCVWNVPKLTLTGFPLVAEGLHPDPEGGEGPGGVEEVSAIATLQRVLGPGRARAVLVAVPGATWGEDFGNDKGRTEWHERKMASKVSRPRRHLELMGLSGTVVHC